MQVWQRVRVGNEPVRRGNRLADVTLPVKISPAVTLRLVEEGDAAQVAAAYIRNREHLAPWEPSRPENYFTAEWHQADIAGLRAAYTAGSSLPLVLTYERAVIGRVTLSGIVRGAFQSASLGYWIDGQHAGRGLMSAAVDAVLAIALDDLHLHRVEAATLLHNAASQRLLRTAGFEQIGVAPRYLRIAGSWQDHRLFQRILEN